MDMKRIEPCCPEKPDLGSRSLLTRDQAGILEATFKMLANDTRLRILHALVLSGELCVSDMAERLHLKPTAVSNQLQRLADRGIVDRRREGNRILYWVIDPCVVKILDSAWCLAEDTETRIQKRTCT